MSAAAAPSSSSSAAGAGVAVAAPSPSASASSSSDLLRENAFYLRPPHAFLDDVASAAQDYLADGCDSLEKLIVAQAGIKAAASSAGGKKQQQQHEAQRKLVGAAVDSFFTAAESQLQQSLPAFERAVIDSVLRIPPQVVVGSELLAAADGFGAHQLMSADAASGISAQEEQQAEEELAALQARLVRNAKLNRALRTELARYEQDQAAYAEYEESFVKSKKEQQAADKLVSDAQSVSIQVGQLRPLQSALSAQFVEVFGPESGRDLTAVVAAATQGRAASSAAAAAAGASVGATPAAAGGGAGAGSAPSSSHSAGSGSVTAAINQAALRAAQKQMQQRHAGGAAGDDGQGEATAAINSSTLSSPGTSGTDATGLVSAAAVDATGSAAAGDMHIDEDAANEL